MAIVAVIEQVMNRRWRWFLALFSVLYWGALIPHASSGRMFWYDELFTLHVANQGDWRDVLRALREGADFHPPLSYLLGHFSMKLVNDPHLGLRLPSLTAFWAMSLAMFFFVHRRCGPVLGAAAMLLPFAAMTSSYAAEARGYALWLAFTSLSLLAWRNAAEGGRRPFAVAALGASLFGAIASHWYGVLSFLPILAGEGLKTAKRRRVDLSVVAAIAAGASALVVLFPLAQSASAYAPGFSRRFEVSAFLHAYAEMLAPAIPPLIAALVLVVLVEFASPDRRAAASSDPPEIPVWEWAAALTLLATPAFCAALSQWTNAFSARYSMPAVLGFALCVAMAASQMRTRRATAGVALLACLFSWFLVFQRFFLMTGLNAAPVHAPAAARLDLSPLRGSAAPIVISDHLQFLPLERYWPEQYSRRTCYVWDDRADRPHHLQALAKWGGLNVAPYREFLARNSEFFILGDGGPHDGWLFDRLVADGVRIEVVDSQGGRLISRAEVAATTRSRSAPPDSARARRD